jgi:hypothetical protein
MIDTLKSLRTEIQLECRGDFSGSTDEDTIVNAAINDATESIWIAMMQVQLAKFFGADSPVTFQLPQGTERITIVSIQDPTVAPVVNQVAGGALADGAIFSVGYTLVTESGSETNISPLTVTAARNPNNLFQVVSPAQPAEGDAGLQPNIYGTAFGYNVYAGPAGALALQNQQPIPFSVNYTEPVTEWQPYPINEQTPPISNTTADNLSWIQHLEIRNSDTLLRAWNQVDIDSEVMRRMARTLSTASEYQQYVWELTGNGVLEFRPMTGSAFSPRYWYVAKPRRLRYDQAAVPYVNITGVHKFLKCQAKADLYLGANEFLNSQGWDGKADKEMAKIQSALMQELWNKNSRVVPFLW